MLIDNCHDYTTAMSFATGNIEDFDEFPPLPVTPSKSPAPKKTMYARESTEHGNSSDIVTSLSALINARSDSIEKMVGDNAMKIEGLKKTIDFACAEIKDMKVKISTIEKQASCEEKRVNVCQQRISELERYSRRWNLRLHGVGETEKEDVRKKAIQICQEVLPEQKDKLVDNIDVVHRLGNKQPNDPKPRGVIIQFSSRIQRDAVWKAAKTSRFLRDNGLRFAEDLSKEDRERRNKLWPMIEKARKEGKAAHFAGGRAFINGSEVNLPP